MIIENIKQFNPLKTEVILSDIKDGDDLRSDEVNIRRKQVGYPVIDARTAISVDLSGSAATLVCLHTERKATIINAYLLYTEASSADAGITVEVGKESDRDYYYTGTTEVSKAIWYSKTLTLLKNDLAAGDTITFYSAGGKTGTGEIMLIIEYIII